MLLANATAAWIVCIAICIRIARQDYRERVISNQNVVALLAVGTIALISETIAMDAWFNLWVGAFAAGITFVFLFLFWLMRKLGAGDVKLIGVAALLCGGQYLLPFSILIVIIAVVMWQAGRYSHLFAPFADPEKLIDKAGYIPFGVPISTSLILVTAARIVTYFL